MGNVWVKVKAKVKAKVKIKGISEREGKIKYS
jgi:hypothetical protein